jgi:hypothetical protein
MVDRKGWPQVTPVASPKVNKPRQPIHRSGFDIQDSKTQEHWQYENKTH